MRTPPATLASLLLTASSILALPAATAAQQTQAFPSGKLGDLDLGVDDLFGSAVALSGTRIAVGAPRDDSPLKSNAGSVSVFDRQGDGSWLPSAKLVPADPGTNHQMGFSVALEGDTLFAGAHQDSTFAGFFAGSVYRYERQGDGTWLLQEKLVASDAAALALFGNSIALSGNTLLVGAPGTVVSGQANVGAAYVFERQASGAWHEVAKLTASDGAGQDNFGFSVALSSGRAVVGAYGDDHAAGVDAGSAYVFERQGSGAWLQVAKLTASGSAAGDWFGRAVAIDGDLVIVGAPFDDTGAGSNAGSATVFERQGSSAYVEKATLLPSVSAPNDAFGWAVSTRAGRALVGAYLQATSAGSAAGAAFLFERTPGGAWTEVKRLTAPDGAPNDRFGVALALSAERAVVGAPYHATGGLSTSGVAYVQRLCNDCAVGFGAGTPGCTGVQTLTANRAPELGAPDFTILGDHAPASSLGLCLVTDSKDASGSDPFGIGVVLHVDFLFATEVYALDITSDALGNAAAPAPLPTSPALAGASYTACAVWAWGACPLPPYQLSSTRGIELKILAP